MTINFGKFILALVSMICVTVLIVTNSIAAEAGLPIITAIAFYSIGNGVNAKTGTATQGVFSTNKGTVAVVPKDAISVVPVDQVPPPSVTP